MLFYSQLSRVTWKRPRPKRDKNQDCYSRGHICLSMAFIHRFISLGELSIIDKLWIRYGTNLFTCTCYRTLSCMWDYVWWFMIKGSSPVTRNLWCQSAPGNQSGAVRHFPEAVRPRDRATGNELRLVSWHQDGSHVCSLSIFFKEFASHSQHHHADIAPTTPMSRTNVRTHRRKFVTTCQACETIFQREMSFFLLIAHFEVSIGDRFLSVKFHM